MTKYLEDKKISLSTSPLKKAITTDRSLLDKIPHDNWLEMIRDAATEALNGDKNTRQYLLDQKLGKAPAKIEHTGSIEHNYIKSIDNIKQQATKLSAIHITTDGISEDVS